MGGTINVTMYLSDEEMKHYTKEKKEINKKTRETFKAEVEKVMNIK